jgi:PIN domain nuclease of toxin-antitoxin system
MPEKIGTLLLDTHVWVWLVDGAEREFAGPALRELQEGSDEGRLLVSVMSVWEVAMLEVKGRIRFSIAIDEWVARGLGLPGLRLSGVTPEIAIRSTRLPGIFHADPVDRILVATAREESARLVTRDIRILQYSRQGHVAAVDPGP